MRARGAMVALAALAALAVWLPACGGGDDTTEAVSPEVVTGAIAKTREAGGVQLQMRHESTNEAGGGEVTTMTASGVMDLGYRRGSLRLDMRELAETFEEASGQEVNPALFVGELRVDGSKLYRRLPFVTQQAGIEEEWIVADTGEPAVGAEGVDFAQLPRINGNDLPQTFDDLTHLIDVERRPDEHRTVGGVETTRYDATVNIEETSTAEAFRSLTGGTRYPVKIWIDERGFARAVEWTVKHRVATADPNRLQDSQRTIDVTIERLGVPVRGKAPPKRETIDQSKLGGIGI